MRLPRGCRINVVVFAQQFPACSSCTVGPFAEGGGRRLMSRVSPSPSPSPSFSFWSSSSLHRGNRLTYTTPSFVLLCGRAGPLVWLDTTDEFTRNKIEIKRSSNVERFVEEDAPGFFRPGFF